MNKTSIEWTDYTWNPVTGCNKVSQGCKNCYAENVATRFWGNRKFTDVQMHEDRLSEPSKNKKKWAGKKVFVCSMSDLFHESVSFHFILGVLCCVERCPDTFFQVLTKRPDRFLEYINWRGDFWIEHDLPKLKNLWIGVSCENQETANQRIPLLLQIPAAVRFLSCEPLLGEIDLTAIDDGNLEHDYYNALVGEYADNSYGKIVNNQPKINWVIAGGESGHSARPMHPDWVRSLRDQCKSANVPFFFKQWGQFLPFGQVDANGLLEVSISGTIEKRLFYKKRGKSKSGHLLDGVEYHEFPT